MIIGKRYVFSIHIKTIESEKDYGGLIPEDFTNCIPDKIPAITLKHVCVQNGRLATLEYRTIQVKKGAWTRCDLSFVCKGGDFFVIDNWDGFMMQGITFEASSVQLEEDNGKGVSTEYDGRGVFLQIYRTGVFADGSAKTNATSKIGKAEKIPYEMTAPKLNLMDASRGIVNQQTEDGKTPLAPIVVAAFTPNIYDQLKVNRGSSLEDAGCPSSFIDEKNKDKGDGGSSDGSDYGTGNNSGNLGEEKKDCQSSKASGMIWTKANGIWEDPNEQGGHMNSIYKIMNEQVAVSRTDSNTNDNVKPGQNHTYSQARASAPLGEKQRSNAGDLTDPEDYGQKEDSAFDSDNNSCTNEPDSPRSSSGYYYCGGSGAKYSKCTVTNSADLAGDTNCKGSGGSGDQEGGEGDEEEEPERDQCKFVKEKRERVINWLKASKYDVGDLITRGSAYARPYMVQYTANNDLFGNASALCQLGFNPEEILGIGG